MRTISGICGLLVLIFIQCSAPKEKIPPPPVILHDDEKLVIYEVLPRLFGNVKTVNEPHATLEKNGVGKLEDITDHAIDGIKELGVTHIQLTGILSHPTTTDYTAFGIPLDNPETVDGKAGSPDVVKDYYDLDPDLAIDVKNRSLEFDRLVERIHKHDLKVIIGLMPGKVEANPSNDSIPGTWNTMRDILVFWAAKKIDGFQCGELEKVPVEFWHWAIPQVKALNPEIIFIGRLEKSTEYTSYIHVGRFDFLMDKVKSYDTLRLLINGKANTTDISRIQKSLKGLDRNIVHFLEHRDEVRIASPFFCDDPLKGLPGMVLSATIDKGPVMIYFGQEVGEPAIGAEGYSSNDGITTLFDYWGMPEFQKWVNGKKYDGGQLTDQQKALRKFYIDLLSFVRNSPAIARGVYFDLTEFNVAAKNFSNKVSAFARIFEDDKLVVITSFNAKPEHIKVLLSADVIAAMKLESAKKYTGIDVLGSAGRVEIAEGNFLEMDMPAFGYAILKVN